MPDFRYHAPGGGSLALRALPGVAVIIAWLTGAGVLLALTTRRLGELR
jgi:ABC-2 type transport system permease protein